MGEPRKTRSTRGIRAPGATRAAGQQSGTRGYVYKADRVPSSQSVSSGNVHGSAFARCIEPKGHRTEGYETMSPAKGLWRH